MLIIKIAFNSKCIGDVIYITLLKNQSLFTLHIFKMFAIINSKFKIRPGEFMDVTNVILLFIASIRFEINQKYH